MRQDKFSFDAVFLDYDNLHADDLDCHALEKLFTHVSRYAFSEPSQIASRLEGAAVAIVSDIPIDAAIFKASPFLKLILVAATGTDNIDLIAAKHYGVQVCPCNDYATWSLAQHAFSLLLALTNNIINYHTTVTSGAWQKATSFSLPLYPIEQLAGKTLGIIGYGASGQRMSYIGAALGMNVRIAALPHRPDKPGRIALDTLLPQVDVLSIHCPLTEQTRGLLSRQRLSLMQPEALIINVSRGAIIDEQALAEMLKSHKLAGAGLDVLSSEPPPPQHPLLQDDIPNLIITPHVAWSSRAARQEVIRQLTENARTFRENMF